MACFVQIVIYTTIYSKIKDKKLQKNKNISLPTYPETEEYIGNRLFFLGLINFTCSTIEPNVWARYITPCNNAGLHCLGPACLAAPSIQLVFYELSFSERDEDAEGDIDTETEVKKMLN